MLLVDARSNLARLGRVDDLVLEVLALGAHAVGGVHALLQLVILPAENVVAVLAEARVVAVAEVEGLRAVGGPEALVVEGRRVPDDFVHELWNADWVRGRAAAAEAEEVGGAAGRVGDVRLVIGRVEVLAVPAAVWVLVISQQSLEGMTYVGKRMLERIPPLQGAVGSSWVSSLYCQIYFSVRRILTHFPSAQGAALSPPKLGPV